MRWARPFIGIPDLAKGRTAAGADCWGLAMLVYREVLGIDLPDYAADYMDSRDHAEIAAIARREKHSSRWRKAAKPKEFDLALFAVARHDSHVGVWCGPGQMLHVVKDDHSKIGRYDEAPWRDRLVGFYCWAG